MAKKGYNQKAPPRKKKSQTLKKVNSQKGKRDQNGDIIIPPEVIDKASYIKYVEACDKLYGDPNLIHQTSDPDLEVNLLTQPVHLRRRCQHLPEHEVEAIIDRAQKFKSISAQAVYLKKLAYGTLQGRNSQTNDQGDVIVHRIFYNERGSELIEYFGRFFTVQEVHRIITMEWGYTISMNALHKFRAENIDKVTLRQEEFKRDYSDIRLGYKRSRLDELSYLYNTRKDIYNDKLKLEDSKELRAIIEQIKKEVEGDVLTINGNITQNINLSMQGVVNQQLMHGLNIKALVLARVASKLRINPALLQYQLINSYYAKFTGFAPADGDILTDEIVYPSAYIYDFDDLRVKNEAQKVEDAEVIEQFTPPIDEDTKSHVQDIRSAIMKKLIENRNMNRQTKENINLKRINKDGNNK